MKGAPPQIGFVLKILDFAKINPYKQTKYTRAYQTIAFSISLYVVLMHLIEITYNFNGIETVGKMRFTPCILIKNYQFVFFAVATKTIRKPFELLENLWPWNKFGTEIGNRMQSISDKWYFFIRFYFWLIVFNVGIMIVEPYVMTTPELVFHQYDYCDMANNPVCYHINFLISAGQLVFIYVPVVFAFDLYFLAFAGQLFIQFELLKIALQECNGERDFIKEIVDQHNVIIDLASSLDAWMSGLFLAKYMGFMLQMISALYMLTIYGLPPSLMDIKTYGLHFMTVALMTYMYCYGGAVIYDQSLSVAESAYSMRAWSEKGRPSLHKDVAFIIMRSQKPELFTAGYFNLNMEAFVSAMQNVISVYGLLATIAADEILAKKITQEIVRH